ncbi:MAG: CaiB/BaiF CoA-transferase family protein [Pseudomonadota bacterium]
MPGPLDGVRVIDLTTVVSGPYCTMILGDQGADVIKIERPDGGDQTRRAGRTSGGVTASFVNNNRNKRSVAVDLKAPEGAEIARRLAASADVVAHNFRPGVMERLGLGAADLTAANPRLIFLEITGFGDTGPLAHKPAYDPILQAVSGMATIQAASDTQRPRMVRALLPDKLAALNGAQAIAAALYARERTGRGQVIKLSMFDAMFSFLWTGEMGGHTFLENEAEGPEGMSPFDLIYETQDGYICVATVASHQFFSFAKAVGREDWITDPRYATSAAREENRTERLSDMQAALLTNTTAHWAGVLDGADVPCIPVLTRREAVHHPHVAAAGAVEIYEHPEAGPVRQARPAAQFSETPAGIRRPAPRLGEHTDEVLGEAGYSVDEIAGLRATGVLPD